MILVSVIGVDALYGEQPVESAETVDPCLKYLGHTADRNSVDDLVFSKLIVGIRVAQGFLDVVEGYHPLGLERAKYMR